MKKIPFILSLVLTSNLFSQQIVILDKAEVCYLDSEFSKCFVDDQNKMEFLEKYKSYISNPFVYNEEVNFDTPPLAWGKKINDFRIGRLMYLTSFPKGFIGAVWFNNLLPNHNYVLTLNGRPDLAGNDLLIDPVPNNEIEKYYDFLVIKTDAKGEYHSKFAVYLKPGKYHVRFYVKDDDDKIIILYHDYFKFTVE